MVEITTNHMFMRAFYNYSGTVNYVVNFTRLKRVKADYVFYYCFLNYSSGSYTLDLKAQELTNVIGYYTLWGAIVNQQSGVF